MSETSYKTNDPFSVLLDLIHRKSDLETFKNWLQQNEDLPTDLRIALQRKMMLEIQVQNLNVRPVQRKVHLSESMQKEASFKTLLSNLPDWNEPVTAHQICILPKTSNPKYIIGDLHADSISLMRIVEISELFNRQSDKSADLPTLVFLGDYVDRGSNHLGLLDCLLALKLWFFDNVVLLKGNHDGGYVEHNGVVKTPYFVGAEEDHLQYFPHLLRHYELGMAKSQAPFFHDYMSFFDILPIVCAWLSQDKVFMAVHGGIPRPSVFTRPLTDKEVFSEVLVGAQEDVIDPRHWFSKLPCIASLTALDAIDEIGRSRIQNMLWSDPSEDDNSMRWHTGRFKFLDIHFTHFSAQFGIDVLFRGHVVQNSGMKSYFDNRIYSVYSTGGQLLSGINRESAYPEVTPAMALEQFGEVIKCSL